MLHSATAHWASSGQAGLEPLMAMGNEAVAVSSRDETALVEAQVATGVAALTSQASYSAASASNTAALYTADTMVMALGLLGAWMMVVGSAMLARRTRLVKG